MWNLDKGGSDDTEKAKGKNVRPAKSTQSLSELRLILILLKCFLFRYFKFMFQLPVELPFVLFPFFFFFFSLMHTSEGHIDVCLQKGTYTHWWWDLGNVSGSQPFTVLSYFRQRGHMSSVNLNNCTKQMWCVSLLCRLMNIWIYLHKACTKLLQLTVIGWTITLLSKMAGEGCFGFFLFCFFEAIFHCVYFILIFFLWLAYVLCWHADCKLGLAVFMFFFLLSALRWRDV